jgi:hypothetical protein
MEYLLMQPYRFQDDDIIVSHYDQYARGGTAFKGPFDTWEHAQEVAELYNGFASTYGEWDRIDRMVG